VSDRFYTLVKLLGRPVFWLASRPLVLHGERLARPGAFIVAANHQSPYDVPVLIRHARRHLDFVSIVEVFRRPFTGWLYRRMNAFPLDRSRPDVAAIRTILRRLELGRAIALFPEGRLTPLGESVVSGGRLRPGIGRIAHLARVPVIPVAIARSEAFGHLRSWLPLRSARYGLSVGDALTPRSELDEKSAAASLEDDLKRSLMNLHRELTAALATSPSWHGPAAHVSSPPGPQNQP
jgi:1-acyl-sn-glycerol-3-phosphate acyltransferase